MSELIYSPVYACGPSVVIRSCSDVNTSPPSWEHLHVISNKSDLPYDGIYGALHLRCSVVRIIHNAHKS